MPDLSERIVTFRISYDPHAAETEFPRIPGDGPEPPVESIHFLIQHVTDVLRSASLTDPALRVCEVDVLTVDHRTPPHTSAATDPNADYFQGV